MARIARVVLPGVAHHVTQRGVRSMKVFLSDKDRRQYLDLLAEQGERAGVRFLAYCLMPNHVHLIAVPKTEESLARAIGEAHRVYTQGINARQGVTGYLFQGRFHSCPLDKAHLVAAARYVERNPVRAGLVETAWDYKWSSARYHVGLRKGDVLVEGSEQVLELDDWREMLRSEPDAVPVLRQKTRTGRPCGGKRFMTHAEAITGRRLRPLPPGRPPKKRK